MGWKADNFYNFLFLVDYDDVDEGGGGVVWKFFRPNFLMGDLSALLARVADPYSFDTDPEPAF